MRPHATPERRLVDATAELAVIQNDAMRKQGVGTDDMAAVVGSGADLPPTGRSKG